MESFFFFFFPAALLILTLLLSSQPDKTLAQQSTIKSTTTLDLLITDYTINSYNRHYLKTGELHSLNHLPNNLSDIQVDVVRYRCGSLRRYGARVKEFHLGPGVTVKPCTERVLLVRQVLGTTWSSMFYSNYDLSGYQVISPVLGLLVLGSNNNSGGKDINISLSSLVVTVNFTDTMRFDPDTVLLCANFLQDRKLSITSPVGPRICSGSVEGHFGLLRELPPVQSGKRESKWKVVVVSSIGAALGFVLLGLLMVAMLVKAKKKSIREEMERRAYEEEALQVSMVGHIRAPTASGIRTAPVIENGYGGLHHS